MVFIKINKVFSKTIRKHHLGSVAEAAHVCRVAREIARGKFEPAVFKNGVLTIVAKDNIQAQELQLVCHQLIDKINQALGQDLVKRLKFRI